MKLNSAQYILSLALVLTPSWALAVDESCSQELERVSQMWMEAKADKVETQNATVETDDGNIDVSAIDAKPTENWFGKPPSAETIDAYINDAKEAAQTGDEEACLELVDSAETAMDPGLVKEGG